jgi:hypothetical protein
MGIVKNPKKAAGKKTGWKKHKWADHKFDPFGSQLVHPDFKKPLSDRQARFLKNRTPANIRVPARHFSATSRWGSGLDEMVQTRLLKTNPQGFGDKELGELHQRERLQTTDLIWATDHHTGLSPLAGHTPALKGHEGRSTRGVVAEEHGTRDGLRENAILQESTARDWGIKSRLATVKYMMSPGEELRGQKGKLMLHDKPLFSVHTSIGDLRKPAQLDKLADRQQELRETVKWHTAAEMLGTGHHDLVPDTFKEFLSQHGNPNTAMDKFRQAAVKTPAIVKNTATTSQTDDLSSHSLSTMTTGRKRALSDARLLPAVKPPH